MEHLGSKPSSARQTPNIQKSLDLSIYVYLPVGLEELIGGELGIQDITGLTT